MVTNTIQLSFQIKSGVDFSAGTGHHFFSEFFRSDDMHCNTLKRGRDISELITFDDMHCNTLKKNGTFKN